MPFAGLTLPRYALKIGLGYTAIVGVTVAIGAAFGSRARDRFPPLVLML